MGCDIHVYREKFSNEPDYGRLDKAQRRDLTLDIIDGDITFDYRWISADKWELETYGNQEDEDYEAYWYTIERRICGYDGRNYQFFNILAGGVRGDENDESVISIPKGVDPSASKPYLEEVNDMSGDGHSHSYLTLKELKEHLPKLKNREILCLVNYELLIEDLEKLNKENGGNPEHVRICFFFDN